MHSFKSNCFMDELLKTSVEKPSVSVLANAALLSLRHTLERNGFHGTVRGEAKKLPACVTRYSHFVGSCSNGIVIGSPAVWLHSLIELYTD